MKHFGKVSSFIVLGIVSFVFFLYLTFPYEVLKEALAMRLSEAAGLNIQIGDLGPSFPVGVAAEQVKITGPGGSAVQLNEARLRVSLFNLLIGRLAIEVDLVDEKEGKLNFESKFNLYKLATGSGSLPSSLFFEADKFIFGNIVDFVLASQSQDPGVNVMVKPWLESVDVDGRLNALVDLSIDESDLSKSEGEAMVSLDNTVIKSLNSNLPIPDQRFSKGLLKAILRNGELSIDKTSAFISQDLAVSLAGKIIQKPDLSKSQLDIDIGIEMGEPLREQFGIVLYAITNRDTQGKLQIKITGAISPQPTVTIL